MRKILFILITIFTIQLANAAPIDKAFFDKTDAFLKAHVRNNGVDYQNLKNNIGLQVLIKEIGQADLSGLNSQSKQAFLINAYNLLVIQGVVKNYPLESVLKVNGFFDAQKFLVAGKKITLNQLEKNWLIKEYGDARYHFVLVCGAIGCPPITNFAYRPEQLEAQLESQTTKALNNPSFIRVNQSDQKVELSKIFEWYAKDFGGGKSASIQFINNYRKQAIPANFKVGFYSYDWSLNKQGGKQADASKGNNSIRYVVSSAIPKGKSELKIFNNLYTQKTGSTESLTDRSTFFTTSVSYIFGLSNRFNAGFDLRYRRVRNDRLPSSPFKVLGKGEAGSSRQGVTAFGPKIRWAPFEKWGNFSIQSSFTFAIGEDLEGTSNQPFIDWNNASWVTQFFNDFTIGDNFSLFTEFDIILEDIGSAGEGAANRFSTPVTGIISYFPTPQMTVYALSGFSPFWNKEFDYFAQLGAGFKYQFTPNFELELLYTSFTNRFLQKTGGQAATFNLGTRFTF